MGGDSVSCLTWRTAFKPYVHTRRWMDGLVAYRADSGDTFFFEPAAFAVLDRLAEGAATAAELNTLADDETAEEAPAELLARLEQAGLIALC